MKTFFKCLLLFLLMIGMAFSLLACDKTEQKPDSSKSQSEVGKTADDDDEAMAMIQFKNGNTTVRIVTVAEGETLTAEQIPAGPQVAGKVFQGWYVGSVKVEAGYQVNRAVIAYAKYTDAPEDQTPTTFTLTFKTSVHGIVVATVQVTAGEPIPASEVPEGPAAAEGYRFVCWKTTDDVPLDLTAPVTEDAIYVAEIELIPVYTLTFKYSADDPEPTIVEVREGEVPAASSLPANPVPEAGSYFAGWKTAEGVAFHKNAPVTASETYFATFTMEPPTICTLTFMRSEDDPDPITVSVTEGEVPAAAALPSDPEAPEGSHFAAWKTADGVAFDQNAEVYANETYFAVFEVNAPTVYTLTFKRSADDPNPVTVFVTEGEVPAAADLPANPEVPAGSQFVGWKTAEGVAFDQNAVVTANETYFATFQVLAADDDDTVPDLFEIIPAVFVGNWSGIVDEQNIMVTITADGEIIGAPVAISVVGITDTMLTLQSDAGTYTLVVIDDTTLCLTELAIEFFKIDV